MIYTTKTAAKKLTGFSYLGSVNSSAKIVKGETENYDTFILYLSPYDSSGFNVCPKASEDCKKDCLFSSGRAKLDKKINESRIRKTKLFYEHREFFNSWLFDEIETAYNKAIKKGRNFAVRINGTSDLSPKLFKVNGVNILERFPNIQFYDYTKVYNRLELAEKYDNYHLTFSYSGENEEESIKAIQRGFNVSAVFYPTIPEKFFNVQTFDADKTDLRFLDGFGIAALKFKPSKNYVSIPREQRNEYLKESKFIILV